MKKVKLFFAVILFAALTGCEFSMSGILDELTVSPGAIVEYDGNGASSGMVPVDSNYYLEDSSVTVLDNMGNLESSNPAEVFIGWNTQKDGLGIKYTTGQTFIMGKNDVTLYAVWGTGAYQVTYSAPDATSGTVPTDNTYYTGGQTVYAQNNGTMGRTGYVFKYWNNGSNNYSAGDSFTITADMTLTAIWASGLTYSVTYNNTGATSGTAPADSKFYEETEIFGVRNNGTLIKTGYNFGGWSDGTSTYSAGDDYTVGASNIIFDPVWTAKTCYVTFNNNGGAGSMASQGIIFGTTEPLTLIGENITHSTKPVFTGWATTAAGDASYEDGANYTMLTEGADLYATWDYHGSPDKFFDSDGFANAGAGRSTVEKGYAIAVQKDGKIVVAGTLYLGTNSAFIVARVNTDGSLDTAFNATGQVPGITSIVLSTIRTYNEATSIAIQSDGKIIVAGTADSGTDLSKIVVVRLDSNGTLDKKNFGVDQTGIVTARINNTFYNRGNYVTIDSVGRIIVAGSVQPAPKASSNFAIWRFSSTGEIDTSFSSDGAATADINNISIDKAFSVVVQSTGIIIVAGTSSDGDNGSSNFALAAFDNTGKIDINFGSEGSGKVITDFGQKEDFACSMALLANDKILVTGYSHDGTKTYYTLAGYDNNGSLDTTFGTSGMVQDYTGAYKSGSDYRNSMIIQSDNKIVIAGNTSETISSPLNITLARYNSNSEPDDTFDGLTGSGNGLVRITGKSGYYANSVAAYSGKIYVAGYCGSVPDIAVMRFWQ